MVFPYVGCPLIRTTDLPVRVRRSGPEGMLICLTIVVFRNKVYGNH